MSLLIRIQLVVLCPSSSATCLHAESTGECEIPRIEHALTKHEQWYVGDGTYGGGPTSQWDYYNSFVIQHALMAVLEASRRALRAWHRVPADG